MSSDVIVVIVCLLFIVILITGAWKSKLKKKEELIQAQIKGQKFEDNQNKLFLSKVTRIITTNINDLTSQYNQTTYKDAYGKINADKWIKKSIPYFLEKVVYPQVKSYYSLFYRDFSSIVLLVNTMVKAKIREEKNKDVNNIFKDSFTGVEYEAFCCKELENLGWKVNVTKKTGDQGVDIVAIKKNQKVGIQCKKYSKPVGNKAIQEVVAGLKFYELEVGVVVSNNGYTEAAKILADKNKIRLIHHTDLKRL